MTLTNRRGIRVAQVGLLINILLVLVKLASGIIGHTYALVADAAESSADILSSIIVWRGLSIAARPPDEDHPFGHGRAEPLAAAVVSLMLLVAALFARTIAPEGWMPVSTPAGGMVMTFCDGMAPDHAMPAMGKMDHKAPHSGHPDRQCPFAALGIADGPPPPPQVAPAATIGNAELALPGIASVPGRGLAAPPPPSTGPPARA